MGEIPAAFRGPSINGFFQLVLNSFALSEVWIQPGKSLGGGLGSPVSNPGQRGGKDPPQTAKILGILLALAQKSGKC